MYQIGSVWNHILQISESLMQTCHHFPTPPQPVQRCSADQWRVDRNLTVTEMADAIGVKRQDLGRALMPMDQDGWREASLTIRKKVRDYTQGAVTLDDWPEKVPPRPCNLGADAPAPSAVPPVPADGAFLSHPKGAA
ncbi:hypothetical protein PQU92_08150 [Asticcacaulis sp. BYS171W]|uniref:Uncharacterized protein n=1 Tax=Asticcacaulis aquaticus TaxID=2984212 RepID=A0ABT5HT50_9CAUL|nr:hypothetical protein [Asticcacaulis aquaticus]MDC7683245.1 hypothetical protein [Asticcacaulis aquaticus]